MGTTLAERLVQDVEQARVALNAVPWWHPLRRQRAARRYRTALLVAALTDIRAQKRKATR